MLLLEDFLDVSDLSRDQIAALSDHKHLSDVAAAMMGEYLMHMHKGTLAVQQMICDDMRDALRSGNTDQVRILFATLHEFAFEYPEITRVRATA
ncbi:unnamed protein product [Ectocarpus sp. 12 AP-2014]